MFEPVRMLMSGLIDYAGLFPPAKLEMQKAVESFARAKMGNHAWMLGRFICPVSRLKEFSKAAAVMMPGTHATSGYREHADIMDPWRVSVLIDVPLRQGLDLVDSFNEHHEKEDNGRAQADVLELKVERPREIDSAIEAIPDHLYPFFEFPAPVVNSGDARGFIAALAGNAAAAKIRTGGIAAETFPAPAAVASFLLACAGAEVPFKATAGLHHPIRAEYPLTYEPGCPRGIMHGFLNVFLAAAMIKVHRIDAGTTARLLEEKDAGAFKFTPEGVRWGRLVLEPAQIALAREVFALSYGSCSFDEPVEDLGRLGLL
jgi:hypothetical protein